jgi:hypothetical protein
MGKPPAAVQTRKCKHTLQVVLILLVLVLVLVRESKFNYFTLTATYLRHLRLRYLCQNEGHARGNVYCD